MATHTPIPHWLSLPWLETCAWYATVAGIQADDHRTGGAG